MKEIKKYDIFVILICFILYGYSIFIGSPIKDNTSFINLCTLIIYAIYLIVNILINKKYKIIKSRLDIFVVLLVFSSYIALIFKNYSNLEATIEYIIKYTAILGIYIIIRDIISKDKKYINYIINTIMISSLTIFIIGLDNITNNFFERFLDLTGNVEVLNDDKRFISIFGYANTAATLMVVVSILVIGKYLCTEKFKEGIFYNIILFTNLVAVIISYSRATWIIAILIYILYIILLKQERIKGIEILIRTRNHKYYIQFYSN